MSKKDNFWIPYADLMTLLMVIFLFISLAFMGLVQKQKQVYIQTKRDIYHDLDSAFRTNLIQWHAELDSTDLSIKFNNPQVLFESGSDLVRDSFKIILTKFIPKYLKIVLQKKYEHDISEIRIEGHTDTKPTNKTDDPYIDNVMLSQSRSMQVLRYIRKLDSFQNLNNKEKERLEYWLTANGLSYGRTLGDDNKPTHDTGKKINEELSRRVEFRIITASSKLTEKF